ncbi:MAG: NAD(P)-dependent oxidoreductase [Bacteroidales bacterium]|jgi:nucleoside-diphosphate-sugar epimerase|nr:NAD(P)-dependent oxidoreductase [Bacteroidales bacterium]
MEDKRIKVLLSGATGFIGSFIAEELIKYNYELLLTKRENSSMENCKSFINKVKWVNLDNETFIEEAVGFSPNIIIHSAWIGVRAEDRDDEILQRENITLFDKFLLIASLSPICKFISMGSQAEYGYLNSVVSETQQPNPLNAYARVKLMVLDKLKEFCLERNILWYWLRIFPIKGKRESASWLLSALEKNINNPNCFEMNFTSAEQKYAYLDVETMANYVLRIVQKRQGKSGIYNISASNAIALKEIIIKIRDEKRPSFKLNFGVLPTRENQSLIIEGSMDKFNKEFL